MPGQLENIANALQGFGAGLQGTFPQLQQSRNQQAQEQRLAQQQQIQQQEIQRKQEEQRLATSYKDAQGALKLFETGDFDAIVELGMGRLQLLKNFPQADPSDTQRLTTLAIGARNGDEESKKLLSSELRTAVKAGKALGFIEEPEVKTKVVGDFLVNEKSGEVIFDATGEGPREKVKDADGRLRFVDTRELVFPQIEEIEKDITDKDMFAKAKTIRAEISKENADFTDIANSFDRITASADDPSAAGDLSLIFNFMKMLDPGSTVREGEFATAANSAGVPDRIRGIYRRIINGERLPPKQRLDFFTQAQNIFTASEARAGNITDEYVRVAEKAGLERGDVVIERGAPPDLSEAIRQAGQNAVTPTLTISTQEQFDNLPSGAVYRDEEGEVRRKP